ncbi:protein of unknown function [Paenibacillus sp. 1_12]|uniref:DUF4188 domain-containing protein n=1 Tax=Paenibacillus sp. 1_12 TaxID=1566278 RepID=UPI0008EEF2B4|nr:DUF4188 domain-containing protein [Paenibacillus sp. 1_12]SFM44443.1 protein of unknown function [Paenibacillus sp. 1_12]
MAKVIPGRYTARMEGDFVVFLIGMRVNRLWAVHKWLPVFLAMGPMVRELYTNRKLGFRGTEFMLGWRSVHLLQYWDSYEQQESYARGGQHLTAWRNFNRKVGTDGTVGIYHETFKIRADEYECVYGNMPVFGLAKVSEHIPAVGKMETSRRRMGGENEPAVPTPVNPQ